MTTPSYIFIDQTVDDYQQMVAQAKPNSRVFLLEGDRDGLAQIQDILVAEAAQHPHSIHDIHLVAHGGPGLLHLGNTTVNLNNLGSYASWFQQWRAVLAPGADLLVYGCQAAAQGWAGWLDTLHRLTGANIAASSEPVGQGRWQLDQQIGRVTAALAFTPALQQSYAGVLTVYALSNNSLLAFETQSPDTVSATVAVTGLAEGEDLVGIDFRPQNGLLYGLASDGEGGVQLYAISTQTGVATAIGTTGNLVDANGDPVLITGNVGFDFNPTVDRIRVVTETGLNLRLNPNTGAFIDGDAVAAGTNPDGSINGGTTTADGTAYTNSFPSTAVTTQYILDAVTDALYLQNPPNAGTATNPLAITLNGNPLDFTAVNGFDIPSGVTVAAANAPATGNALAALTVGGVAGLYSISLATGAATLVASIGNGTLPVQGLAAQNTIAPAIGLDATGTNLLRFSTATPGTVATVAIAGITAGETLVGIDFRPATGQLFGFGVDSVADTGTLYILDPQTGVATVVGTPSSIAFVDAMGNPVDLPATGYGFDFNPTVDRIRLVNSNGLNSRLNPITGGAVDGDNGGAPGSVAGINPDGGIAGATGVDGTAYTNSFAGTTITTQYTLDASTDTLFIQNPPNAGVQTSGLAITLNGNPLDFTEVSGFDISSRVRVATSNTPAQGQGIAALTVGGSTGLYSIDLATGAATLLGAIGDGTTGLAGLAVGDAPVVSAPVNQTLIGDAGNNILRGGLGNDRLLGLGGNDRLLGGAGNDRLNGGAGRDLLFGGRGADTLFGSVGGDRFVYDGSSQGDAFANSLIRSLDHITDFNAVMGDRILLDYDNNLGTRELPRQLSNAGTKGGSNLNQATRAAFIDKNQRAAGNQSLRPNDAVLFTWQQQTYLAVNNGTASFSIQEDLLINVTGITLRPGDQTAGVLSVTNYFA